jgi:hypothetical protein
MGRITEITKKQAISRSTQRKTQTLPQTGTTKLFTVTGNVIIDQIIGEVTTVIETQANATKLVANPTVGADVDLCVALDISADALGSTYNITGTLTDALVNVPGGAGVLAGGKVLVHDGTIDLNCAASNTGSIKWTVHWTPVDKTSNLVVNGPDSLVV